MKSPAILFYTSDFLTGCTLMDYEQRGKYITLLSLQHQKGHLSEEDFFSICDKDDKKIISKFKIDKKNCYFNQRMDEEIIKRNKYTESRSKNRANNPNHMKNISLSYDNHMDNENDNINSIDNIITYYSSNIHTITPIEYEKLTKWEATFSEDMIKYAIELAVKANARSFNYIEAIFKSWKTKGYKTIIDIERLDNKKNKKEDTPSWYNQEIKKEDITKEEQEELDNILKEFK